MLTGLLSDTVNRPLVDGSEACAVAAMLTTEASLSLIVTVPVLLGAVATVTAVLVELNVTITVSPPVSTVLSSITVTGMVTLVVLAGITTVVPMPV